PVDIVVTDTGQRVLLFNPDTGVFSFSPGDTVDGQVNYGVTGNYRGVVSLRVTPTPPQGGVDLVFPKGSSFDTRTAPQGKVEFQLRAAPNAPLREEPARFVIEAEPDPPVPADSVNVDYRVISPNDPMVMLFISKPMQGARFSGESFIDFEVRTLRPSGCPEPPQYTATVTPAGIIDTPAFINGDFAQSTVRASNPAEPKQALIRIDVTSPPCLSDSDSIAINIDPRPVPQPLATATLSPAGQTIQRGQSATYALTVSRGGATGPVAVAIAGLPASVTATVTPNPLPGDVAQIVLATNSVTPTGTFPFTVNATLAGAPLASVTGTLTVMSPPPPGLPAITSFSPANGVAGTPVQIFGTNLTNVQNVLFSNGVGAPFAQISANQVNTTVPGFAMTGPITVITAGGVAVSSPPFIVGTQSQAPQITSFSPASGAAGTSVRLQGVNLGNPFDVSLGTAAFGFTPIPFTPFDATRIDVVIPPATPSGFFRVATPGGTATSTTAFNVTTPNLPEIGGFNPISGPPGTRVEIIGANLGGATQVTFGGVPASFEPPQPNRIFATVPPNAATGQIRVTTPNGTAISFASFAVTSGGPVITDIQPRMGSEGFSVTIAGANLSNASEVTFNGVRAVIGIVTANFVQAFVPPGATTGFVRITTPAGSATSPVEFMVQ
ncbi:MAG TPA: IPT/TIG domain-containing protein, partial [Thermoanaerobaculia bacterium]|nr:IPT/TIG domain-containing protein [Thermoanaerobaculia bacterium]